MQDVSKSFDWILPAYSAKLVAEKLLQKYGVARNSVVESKRWWSFQ